MDDSKGPAREQSPEHGRIVRIDEGQIRSHLDEVVRGTVEETLSALLEAKADGLCKAGRYEHSPEQADRRAGHY
jgi:putative transposase